MAMAKTNTTVGYFQTRSQAEKALEELRKAGFRSDQIGMAAGQEAEQSSESFWHKVIPFMGNKVEYEYNVGQLQSSLEGAGVNRERARYFEYLLAHGNGAIVTVSASGREQEAERIIEQAGGNVGQEAATFQYPEARTQPASGRQRIQLLGEVLRIHKERVPLGEVRLRKEVVTETQNVQVPTSREELVIERHPGGEAMASEEIGQQPEIRVPLSEEQVRVEKKPVVREDVEVGKRSVEQTRNVSEQVRREELHVEKDEKTKVNEENEEEEKPKANRRGA